MKRKIILSYTPEKNLQNGIRAEMFGDVIIHTDIIKGKKEYELPEGNIVVVYAYTPMKAEEAE